MYKNISVLGSTGSIGTQTLDVCRKHGINVVAISANRSIETIEQQIKEFKLAHLRNSCVFGKILYYS